MSGRQALERWSNPLRWIGWILAAILMVGWVAAELPPMVAPTQFSVPDPWRRTSNGWERARWLLPQPEPAPWWLHPVSLATFEAVVSVAGLLGLSRGGGRRQSGSESPLPAAVHPACLPARNCSNRCSSIALRAPAMRR